MNRFNSDMTPAELRAWIEARYATQGEACAAFGIHQRTLTHWLGGVRAMPLMLDRLIEAMETIESQTRDEKK